MSNQSCINIRVVAHYPDPHKANHGTFHVIWEEIGLEVKGCIYQLTKNGSLGFLPQRWAKDPETKKTIRYPVINWVDPILVKSFRQALIGSWTAYAKQKNLLWAQPKPGEFKPYKRKQFKPKGQFKPKLSFTPRPRPVEKGGYTKPDGTYVQMPRPIVKRVWTDLPKKPA